MVIMEWKKITFIGLFFISCIFLLRTILLLWNTNLPDFGVYYFAAKTLSIGGNPYIDKTLFTQLNYPPQAILPFYPLLLMQFVYAEKVWLLLSICSFLVTFILLYRWIKVNKAVFSIVFLLTVISFPFKFTLGMGQVNAILLLCICTFLLFLKNKSTKFSALFLAIISILKLFPAIFFLPLLLTKRYRVLCVAIIFILGISLFSISFVGVNVHIYYITHVLTNLLTTSGGNSYYNQSLTGLFGRLETPSFLSIVVRMVVILISVFIIMWKKTSIEKSLVLFLSMMLLINSFTWQHHLLLLLIPFYLLLSKKQSLLVYVYLLLSYILISTNIKSPDIYKDSWYSAIILSHATFGILFLWLLQLFDIWKEKL